MKAIVPFIAALLLHTGLCAQSFTIKGTMTGTPPAYIRLNYMDVSGSRVQDSTRVVNGAFSFQGKIGEPQMAYLSSGSWEQRHTLSFFIEPAVIQVALPTDDYSAARITGSASQKEYEALTVARMPVLEERKPLEKQYQEASQAYAAAVKANKPEAERDTLKYRAAAIHDQFDIYARRLAAIDYAFFDQHPQSWVTVTTLQYHVNSLSLDSLDLFYKRLGNTVQSSEAGKKLAGEIAKLRAGSPGSLAADFTTAQLEGGVLKLSALRGKYVLIDFWASWCVPCRKSMPHVKELYARYKDKGFDVIAVADDDRDSTAWTHAIEKDGTGEWHNVLRGFDMQKVRNSVPNPNDIAEKFGIHELPTKILIDPNGRIIGRYDKGTEAEARALDKALEEAFR